MSQVIEFSTKELHNVLLPLSKLVPKGSKTVPIGIHLENGEMTIVCQQGLVYQDVVYTKNVSAVAHTTALYFDITSMLCEDGTTCVCFNDNGITFYNMTFSISLQRGYSVVDKVEYNTDGMQAIASNMYIDSIKSLTSMKLGVLYNKDVPIVILDNVVLQKFPNTWVQLRADGLNVTAMVELQYLQLLTVFKPERVSQAVNNIITFARGNAILRVACKPPQDLDKITVLMDDLMETVDLTLGRYLDRVAILIKYESHITCNIELYEQGLRTIVNSNGATFNASVGNTNTRLIKVFQYPADVWYTFLRVLGVDRIQILYGGDKICLRSPLAVIVTRVLH